MTKRNIFFTSFLALCTICSLFLIAPLSSCKVTYGFKDISLPDSIKTVKVNMIQNRSNYINPQLAPKITEKFRQKLISNTKLSQTDDDKADWVINASITNYSFATAGISNQTESATRINVTIQVTRMQQKGNDKKEYSVTRNFDYSSKLSTSQGEASVFEDMVKNLSDDMFNQLFSSW